MLAPGAACLRNQYRCGIQASETSVSRNNRGVLHRAILFGVTLIATLKGAERERVSGGYRTSFRQKRDGRHPRRPHLLFNRSRATSFCDRPQDRETS